MTVTNLVRPELTWAQELIDLSYIGRRILMNRSVVNGVVLPAPPADLPPPAKAKSWTDHALAEMCS